MHICALCYICSICQVWCSGIQGIYAQLTGGGVGLPCIYVHCAICARSAKFGVAVFKASMLDWLGGGSICNGYICIVLCMRCIWCDGFPEIYAQLEEGGVNLPWVYVHCAISAKCGVVVFKAPMLNWRRGGVGSICHGYMSILLDMKLIWCSGFPEIYAHLEGVGQSAMMTWYMCIVLYMQLLWCSGVT